MSLKIMLSKIIASVVTAFFHMEIVHWTELFSVYSTLLLALKHGKKIQKQISYLQLPGLPAQRNSVWNHTCFPSLFMDEPKIC